MNPWYGRLEALSPARRMQVASAALDGAVASLDPSYEAVVTDEHRRIIDGLRDAARQAASAGDAGLDLDEIEPAFALIGDALEDPHGGEAHALLLSLLNLPGGDGLTVDALAGILDGAYQSVVANSDVEVYGVETERASPRCRDAIAAQQRLIEAAAT
jgi:hypothetical protein